MNPDLANLKAIAMTNAAQLMAQQQAPQYGSNSEAAPLIAKTLAPAWNADTAVKQSNAQGYNDQASLEAQKLKTQYDYEQSKTMNDPANFKRVKNNVDGGWNFYDPAGKPISAYDYANAVGGTPADVLKDSENPIDIGYLQDWQNLNSLWEAMNSKDQDTIDDYVEKNPALKNMSIAQTIDAFKKAYPTVYGGNKPGVRAGSLYVPTSDMTGGGGM